MRLGRWRNRGDKIVLAGNLSKGINRIAASTAIGRSDLLQMTLRQLLTLKRDLNG